MGKHDESVHLKRKKSCPECGKQVANVAEHVRLVHIKEKKFQCDFCPYMCSKQSDMKKHSRNVHRNVHTKEKKFKCKICMYMCSKKSDIRKHSRNVHKIDHDLE